MKPCFVWEKKKKKGRKGVSWYLKNFFLLSFTLSPIAQHLSNCDFNE
jgi:hypothetical protein